MRMTTRNDWASVYRMSAIALMLAVAPAMVTHAGSEQGTGTESHSAGPQNEGLVRVEDGEGAGRRVAIRREGGEAKRFLFPGDIDPDQFGAGEGAGRRIVIKRDGEETERFLFPDDFDPEQFGAGEGAGRRIVIKRDGEESEKFLFPDDFDPEQFGAGEGAGRRIVIKRDGEAAGRVLYYGGHRQGSNEE